MVLFFQATIKSIATCYMETPTKQFFCSSFHKAYHYRNSIVCFGKKENRGQKIWFLQISKKYIGHYGKKDFMFPVFTSITKSKIVFIDKKENRIPKISFFQVSKTYFGRFSNKDFMFPDFNLVTRSKIVCFDKKVNRIPKGFSPKQSKNLFWTFWQEGFYESGFHFRHIIQNFVRFDFLELYVLAL